MTTDHATRERQEFLAKEAADAEIASWKRLMRLIPLKFELYFMSLRHPEWKVRRKNEPSR